VGVMMKKDLTNIARGLRRNATDAEKALWQRLSRRQTGGFKFRRQQPIGKYVVDFVTFDKKLVIELDGGQHKIQKDEDKKRDKWFEEQGFRVLRFWNNDLFENLEGILELVREKLLSPSPDPSRQGRGDMD
jgi:very-short-patch-repair endonuclease